jgi:hypothetical protein
MMEDKKECGRDVEMMKSIPQTMILVTTNPIWTRRILKLLTVAP